MQATATFATKTSLAPSAELNHPHSLCIPMVRRAFHSESSFPGKATFGIDSYMDVPLNTTMLINPHFPVLIEYKIVYITFYGWIYIFHCTCFQEKVCHYFYNCFYSKCSDKFYSLVQAVQTFTTKPSLATSTELNHLHSLNTPCSEYNDKLHPHPR